MSDLHAEVFATRLKQARVLRKMSLGKLAEAAGAVVSKQAIGKYEKAQMLPGSEVAIALANALDVNINSLFRPTQVELSSLDFRRHSKLGKRDQVAIGEQARGFLERYIELEGVLDIRRKFSNPIKGFKTVSGADIERAADAVRKAWNIGFDPISNVVEMLEDNGVKVCEINAPEGFDGLSGWGDGVPFVVLKRLLDDEDDFARQRLTALHELGHLLLPLPDDASKKEREDAAYRFAGALLLPARALRGILGQVRHDIGFPELRFIKGQFGISMAAVMRRARELDVISAHRYKWYCIDNRQKGWHKREPFPYRPANGDELSHRFDQLLCRAVYEDAITMSKAAELADVDLTEMRDRFEPALEEAMV